MVGGLRQRSVFGAARRVKELEAAIVVGEIRLAKSKLGSRERIGKSVKIAEDTPARGAASLGGDVM